MHTARTPNLKCRAVGKPRAFILTMCSFQNILPTAEPMIGRGRRHSSCRWPTFGLPLLTCRHRHLCWFTNKENGSTKVIVYNI